MNCKRLACLVSETNLGRGSQVGCTLLPITLTHQPRKRREIVFVRSKSPSLCYEKGWLASDLALQNNPLSTLILVEQSFELEPCDQSICCGHFLRMSKKNRAFAYTVERSINKILQERAQHLVSGYIFGRIKSASLGREVDMPSH